jgi:hypothetical protein
VRGEQEFYVYLTLIRSHLAPDNIRRGEGREMKFHTTNLERDTGCAAALPSKEHLSTQNPMVMPG